MQKKKAGRIGKKPSKEIFELMYERCTAKQLAKYYEVTPQTIYNWSSQYRKEK